MAFDYLSSVKDRQLEYYALMPKERFIDRLAGRDSTSSERVLKLYDTQLSQRSVSKAQWIPQLFWWSCRHGNEHLTTTLLSSEKDAINYGQMAGETGAHMFSFWGKERLVSTYVEHKMPIDIPDKNHLTPLYWSLASDRGPESHSRQTFVVDYLRNAGAAAESATSFTFTNGIIRDCLSGKENRRRWFGDDAEEILGSFRRLETEINCGSAVEREELHLFKRLWLWKFSAYRTQNSFELCRDLLQGKNSPAADACKPLFVTSAFHRAARYGNVRLLRYMLGNDLVRDINCGDELGWTALHNAAWHGNSCNEEGFALLLKRGADFNITSTEGTAAQIARDYDNYGVLKLLRKRKRKHDQFNPRKIISKNGAVAVYGNDNIININLDAK